MSEISEDCRKFIERSYKPTSIGSLQSYDEFWIAPNGQCWKINSSHGHHGFAAWWLANNGVDPEKVCSHGFYPTNELQKRGWIRVSSGVTVLPKHPTAAQSDAIYDWMGKNGGELYLGGEAVPEIRKYTTQEFLDTVASLKLSKRSSGYNCAA